MTVKQLARKLSKLPQDATVTLQNNDLYLNGDYIATNVELWEENEVRIISDYKKRIREYEE
jgi:hypothetical protein